MTSPVDLRSDTVTRPTPAMRKAIAEAEVGDDVFGEDPTVNRLEARIAEQLGKEAAIFVISGTMANQLAIRTQTRPGDAMVSDRWAHPYRFEAGGAAVLSGVTICPVDSERGVISPQQVEQWMGAPDNAHFAPVRLVTVENTHNLSGGAVIPRQRIQPLLDFTAKQGMVAHLDGARLFNAACATGSSVAELAAGFDSVSCCFSKGLGAPSGSALAASREVITLARRMRKMLGGGWRQAGILAAAALHALEHHVDRLADDHRRAGQLASGIEGFAAELTVRRPVESNIVLVDCGALEAKKLVQQLAEHGIRCLAIPGNIIRLVTHLEIDDRCVERTLHAFEQALQ